MILGTRKQLIYKAIVVEAAGIEPASENHSRKVPTCFSCLRNLAPSFPTGRALRTPALIESRQTASKQNGPTSPQCDVLFNPADKGQKDVSC